MKIENYYLDLERINKLESMEQRDQIHRYYTDMMHYSVDVDGRDSMAQSIFNTLKQFGYLVDIRDEKIETIIKG